MSQLMRIKTDTLFCAGVLGLCFGIRKAAADYQERVSSAAAHVQRAEQRPPALSVLHCRVHRPLTLESIFCLFQPSIVILAGTASFSKGVN